MVLGSDCARARAAIPSLTGTWETLGAQPRFVGSSTARLNFKPCIQPIQETRSARSSTPAALVAVALVPPLVAARQLARRRHRQRVRSSVRLRATAGATLERKPTLQNKTPSSKDESARRDSRGGYSADRVEREALQDIGAVVSRFSGVVFGLGGFYARIKLDEWRGNDGPDVVLEQSRALRELLIDLGPCYVKLGQALSNRPDIVRDDYMDELEKLQDNVPAYPSAQAMEILQKELGRGVSDIYSELSAEPVAAASFGQVYRGRLRSNGEEVAVKVQRPNLKTALVTDMYIFRRLATVADEWAQAQLGCSASLIVDEFGAKLWEESDYRLEAANAQEFAANFGEDPTVKIMGVYPELTSKRVITMEWIEGVKCTDLKGLRRIGCDPNVFIRNGVQAALRQLLEFGLFHGDLHSGNIFALSDNRIAYVDFGNVSYIKSGERDILVRALTHVANSDYPGIADDFVRLGMLPRSFDTKELLPAMANVWKDSFGTMVQDFTFKKVTAGFSRLVFRFPMRIPERFSLVFRALLMQEGICMSLDPSFSIIEVALPYASQRLLSDPDPSMRRELQNVVFKEEDGRQVIQWDRLKNLLEMANVAKDGTGINFDEVIVNFFRGLRRDLFLAVAAGKAEVAASSSASAAADSVSEDVALLRLASPFQVPRFGLASVFRKAREVVADGIEVLTDGGRLRLSDVQQDVQDVLDLLGPDVLKPELAKKIADAWVQDSVQDIITDNGLDLDVAEILAEPTRLAQALGPPEPLRKLLTLPLQPLLGQRR